MNSYVLLNRLSKLWKGDKRGTSQAFYRSYASRSNNSTILEHEFKILFIIFHKNNFEVRKAANIKNRYNQVSHLSLATIWESGKNTSKHHKQEPRGQPFPSRSCFCLKYSEMFPYKCNALCVSCHNITKYVSHLSLINYI